MQKININLERDGRYVAAKNKLVGLQLELKRLEEERAGCLSEINQKSLDNKPQKSRLDLQAESLLENGATSELVVSTRSARKSYAELTDKIVILMHALAIQRSRLDELKAEISKQISLECLPQHQANVAAIVGALLKLESALSAEAGLRDELHHNGLEYQSHIRPMPFRGVGLLSDHQSAVSRYLLECLENGFIAKRDLPECLHKYIPSRGDEKKSKPIAAKISEWVNAN